MRKRAALALVAAALAVAPALPPAPGAAEAGPGEVFRLDVLPDTALFALYINEEPVARISSAWAAGGAFRERTTLSVGGQSFTSTLAIEVDEKGLWKLITIESPRGNAIVTRDSLKANILAQKRTHTLDLKPGTLLFENTSPALMGQAVAAYDQAKGGTQTFPLFIVPLVVMDASLERLDTVERFIGSEPRTFTLYRYGLPGVDVVIWVDEKGRICLADVPAQRAAYVREGYEALRLQPALDSLLSQPMYEVSVDKNVMVPMRDGVNLATDVYRPAADGRYPVVLLRTPYAKDMSELKARFYARRGYVFAVQDCRGRFGSQGTWTPFFAEPNDGYDAVEWLAVQPWSTGKVGMIGASYVGWVQWWAASANPPHLATIVPNVSPPDPYFNMPYEYGSFFLLGAIWWADVLEKQATADLTGKTMMAIGSLDYDRLLRRLPVVDLDRAVLGGENRYWREWIKHPANDAYWAKASFLSSLEGFDRPVYHQSGWFDGDGIGSKLNYLAMTGFGHGNQKLVLGPWGHTDAAMRQGPNDRDFGPNAIVDLEGSYLRWFDRWLKGVENGIETEPLVALFVMNTNRWLVGSVYPLPETRTTPLYLASGGKANTSKGDGTLSFDAPPGGAPFDTYVYDPADPTPDPEFYVEPAKEGAAKDSAKAISVEAERAKAFAYHEKVNAERSDILVYDTAPAQDSLVIAGPVSAVLYASSSAKDTDWFVRLSEIDEKALVYPLVHGTIRARFRESFAKAKMLEPGTIYEYRLDLWQTGVTIPKGHTLRVEVASAAFPTFSRNLNTGGHNETETKFVPATQKIYHDAAHPSRVLLPVIEKPAFKDQPW